MDAQDFASVWQGEHFHGVRMVVDGELIDHYAFEYGDNSLDVAKQYGAEPFEQLLDAKMDEWVKQHDRVLKNTNDALQAENVKLRDLATGLYKCWVNEGCEGCPMQDDDGWCVRDIRLRDLGVEVSE